jgi:hypothetical protein
VPGAENAVAHDDKFVQYLLNPDHPNGKHKARVFAASLGFDLSNWQKFRDIVLRELPYVPGRRTRVNLANPPGENREAVIHVQGPRGAADVVTAWAVNPTERTRFVTAYPD